MSDVSVRVRVPFADVDSSQRIHYTAMFRYMEVAEHALMRSIGFPYATTLRELAFPRVRLSCDFKGAIFYDDLLDITARVEHVGVSSWTVAFLALPASPESAGEDAVRGVSAPVEARERSRDWLAEGHMTIVAMDPTTERATPVPAGLRRALLGETGARQKPDDEADDWDFMPPSAAE
ncbi:MAG: thioesterase family protein [Ktedonobacterales bacterium]